MQATKSTDFKSNVADLTKIPPNEFEKYFQEWMERDDVARSLQAKLRCDLIKNFNKTNLGKHILSHTMTSAGGATLRLTLSPLVLALNTLVAEFLYAQNCHFTLSVFCTEIPFRNTLPDFESMRRFRFNNEEISEIWQAVTGSKANKCDLNKNIIQLYEKNHNNSLLLLIIKCLLKNDSLQQLKRNAEVQTEIQEKLHKSISARDSAQDRNFCSKTTTDKDDNFHYINKYLQTLSEKVIEMTKEFEEFAKQRREARSRHPRSSRSRDFYTLNKSLERITENMKAMVQAKRKNKRLSTIVAAIDNLTKQFGKCALKFDTATRVLYGKDNNAVVEKATHAKVKLKEKQTETEPLEKSYIDWIHEMRNTENGRKFLNRVEISLRKALMQHRDQLQNEMNVKMKQLKSLLRLHYKQKLSKHLLENPSLNLDYARQCNDNIEKKLQEFERKQQELLQTLQESSLELKEAQLRQREDYNILIEKKVREDECNTSTEFALGQADTNKISKCALIPSNLKNSQNIEDVRHNDSSSGIMDDELKKKIPPECPVRDVSKAQEQIVEIVQTLTERGRSVDRIIYDAKLRIQKLEYESKQLEQNFQSYLERRKRSQQQETINRNVPEICSNLKHLCEVTSARLLEVPRNAITDAKDLNGESDEEFYLLQKELQQKCETSSGNEKSAKSEASTSSLEIRNAILEAKLKFFEHENIMRQCRAQGDEIRNGNFLQKQLEKCSEKSKLPDHLDHAVEHFISPVHKHLETETNHKDKLESNIEVNIEGKSLDEEQDIHLSPSTQSKSEKNENALTGGVRKRLFRDDVLENGKVVVGNTYRAHEAQNCIDAELYSKQEQLKRQVVQRTHSASKLIEQSMAKMQLLFEQQSKSEMVAELNEQSDFQEEMPKTTTKMSLLHVSEALEKSITTTTITSLTANTSNATKTSEELALQNHHKIVKSLNRISNTSMPSLLNSFSDSESSIDSNHQQIEIKTRKNNASTTRNPEEANTPNVHRAISDISKSSESSELCLSPLPNKVYPDPQPDLQLELGQLNESPELCNLNVCGPVNDKEMGEIADTSNRKFAAIDGKLGESFSTTSSSDFEISTGHQNRDDKNLADDIESDFWS